MVPCRDADFSAEKVQEFSHAIVTHPPAFIKQFL
jgi:hypothetical protein